MKAFSLLALLIMPAAWAQGSDARLQDFEHYWSRNTGQGCTEVQVTEIATVPNGDATATPAARQLYLELKLAGGVASWPAGNSWNIVMLADVAERAKLTDDTLDFMLCHELGHFTAKATKTYDDTNAEELFADQYAIEKCLPKYWSIDPRSARGRARIREAFEGGMDYDSEFLRHGPSLGGDSAENLAMLACRRKAGLATLSGKPAPACVHKLFGSEFYEDYRRRS